MCDKCQQLEIKNKVLENMLKDLRIILKLSPGESVVKAVKDLKEREMPCESAKEDRERLGRNSIMNIHDREKVKKLMEKYNIPFNTKEAYRDRVKKLVNAGLEDVLENEEYEFLIRVRSVAARSS